MLEQHIRLKIDIHAQNYQTRPGVSVGGLCECDFQPDVFDRFEAQICEREQKR